MRAIVAHPRGPEVIGSRLLLVRAGLVYNHGLLTAAGLAAAGVGAALWVLSAIQYSALAGRQLGHLAGRPRAILGLAASVTLLSMSALIATLVR